ncbi:NifB/NifX family molybdenum-iron cluster-binding protein [Ancylomarina sp. 16SWW S1-10-2]|uniref:NifB/NifX family molybdenum-iron cluster-binding protein n=1 Tax=Ancylomarina sp. 16SWW S1-10-2 TaxID=2499681 RepID=UPI0018A0BD9B|nr:NifB/NifX family molybdenum-iron cluster-binding protein [Ancylomarina sp. 16SWW S1-10-2]
MNKNIKFAFAVNHSNTFESRHFGDADKFLVFEWNGSEMLLQDELINIFKSFDEAQEHGSQKKGKSIIELLQKNNIQVLVSKQFGLNIKMVNQFFILVVIDKETSDEVLKILSNHIVWIEDELQNNLNDFKLFSIRKGILKTIITKKK